MIATIRHCAAALLAVLLATAAPVVAQTNVSNPPDPYVHRGTGVGLPAQIGPFARGRVTEYDAEGADASAGYKPPSGQGAMTVYIYPLQGTCGAAYRSSDREVVKHPGTTRRAEDVPLRLFAEGTADQFSASYTVPPGGYGVDHPELTSFLWVGCPANGKWVVKFRGSFVAEDAPDAAKLAGVLFAGIDWSPLLGK